MTTPTANKGFSQISTGDLIGAWGPVLNTNWALVDAAIAGGTAITLSNANVTLTSTQAQNIHLVFTGTLTTNVTVYVPAQGGLYLVTNVVSGPYVVTVACVGGGTSTIVAQGNHQTMLFCDSTNIFFFSSTYQPFFRLMGPSTILPSGQVAQISNYSAIEAQYNDIVVSAASGVAIIGTTDAGIYAITAGCSAQGEPDTNLRWLGLMGLSESAEG